MSPLWDRCSRVGITGSSSSPAEPDDDSDHKSGKQRSPTRCYYDDCNTEVIHPSAHFHITTIEKKAVSTHVDNFAGDEVAPSSPEAEVFCTSGDSAEGEGRQDVELSVSPPTGSMSVT